jgi:flagellar motor switch protein FliM
MIKKTRNKLTLEKVNQILACIGATQGQAADQIESKEYDWTQPHYFTTAQLEKLKDFTQTVSSALAATFDRFLRSSFDVQPAEITQHYAQKFINELFENPQNALYLILKSEKDTSCGLIIVPKETAASWLKLLLGESETKADADQQLSQLEKFLLTDIIFHLAETIANSNRQLNLKTTKNLLTENFTLDISSTEEICKITFDVKQKGADKNNQMHLLLPCSRFLPIVGAAANKKTLTPEQVKNAILEHVKLLPVSVTARFARTELKFEHILTLQKGDILILDKKISEPIELVVDGKTRYLAQLAKSGGRLAVKITHSNTKEP